MHFTKLRGPFACAKSRVNQPNVSTSGRFLERYVHSRGHFACLPSVSNPLIGNDLKILSLLRTVLLGVGKFPTIHKVAARPGI